MSITHKDRMIRRRLKQRALTPGFIPVTNHRIAAKVKATEAIVIAAAKEVGNELTPMAANDQAWRLVAAKLPAVPVGVRTRPYGARGKDYRHAEAA